MRTVILSISVLLIPFFVQSQEVRSQILDYNSKEPIPFANILISKERGVVSNEEGFFEFNLQQDQLDSLKISSLGYETLQIDWKKIDSIVYLQPADIELEEVFLSNEKLSPEEIMERAKEALVKNYEFGLGKKRIFLRESSYNHIRKFELEVDESTIAGIDQDLLDQIVQEVPKTTDSYREVLADLYGNYDHQKLKIVKAANLYDPRSTQSLEELTKELENLFRKNLKQNSFLKIRSGLLGVKVDAEELEEGLAETEKEQKEKTPAELEEEQLKTRRNLQEHTDREIQSLLNNVFWKEDITFDLFDRTGRYDFNMEGIVRLENSPVYVIGFERKRGPEFTGKLYINTLDYGVHRIDYENNQPLSSFGLFGVSTSKDRYRGKMIFVKNKAGKYRLSYLERERGETIGFDRPLTIIEKNRHVPGRNKQNELDLDLDLRLSQVEKIQLVVYEDRPLARSEFDSFQPSPLFEYQTFKKYNPDFWDGHNIIEPNTAIQEFTALEKEP